MLDPFPSLTSSPILSIALSSPEQNDKLQNNASTYMPVFQLNSHSIVVRNNRCSMYRPSQYNHKPQGDATTSHLSSINVSLILWIIHPLFITLLSHEARPSICLPKITTTSKLQLFSFSLLISCLQMRQVDNATHAARHASGEV